MTLFRKYLDDLNKPYKKARRAIRFTWVGTVVWVLLLVVVVWVVAESYIQPPLNLTGEEARIENGI